MSRTQVQVSFGGEFLLCSRAGEQLEPRRQALLLQAVALTIRSSGLFEVDRAVPDRRTLGIVNIESPYRLPGKKRQLLMPVAITHRGETATKEVLDDHGTEVADRCLIGALQPDGTTLCATTQLVTVKNWAETRNWTVTV